ncbi:hypothetical protein [Campylobacter concisus]|uniref:hypothetical protein n=1 Tax=Campylobacter concisus TaxID=199 RepID=UPI00122D3709|nr:hypothetical protein [Campylobacter concisus]
MKEKKLIIKDIQGEIYIISQDGSIKMLKDGDEIYAGEKIFTKNLDAKITLEDGEQINLNAHQSVNLDEILKISAKPAEEKGESEHGYGSSASEGISLSAASFVTSGHSANIHQIYNQHRYLEPNVSSAQLTQLKSASGASSTLVEKSSAAAEPKEEPFIDTINVLNVTNRGLDADIWLYDSARNHGRGLDYYNTEPTIKTMLKEWSANHHVSATSTLDDLRYGTKSDYAISHKPADKQAILMNRTPLANELAIIGRSPDSNTTTDRIGDAIEGYKNPDRKNGNYNLYESKIVADGIIASFDGWIYIRNSSLVNAFSFFDIKERQNYKIEFDGREIFWKAFTDLTGTYETSYLDRLDSNVHLTQDGGFYKFHVETSDELFEYSLKLSINYSRGGFLYTNDGSIKLVSNAYMEALAQNNLVTKESDTFYKAKEINGVKFGDNASDFDKPFDLEFKGTKDVGSNLDDKFIFNSHDIDAKGGIDTLVFTQNVDLTKISELDKRLESFERIELDHTKAVKLKLNGQNIIDMIDSNPTKGPDGLESLNTILKISGDSDDVVQLVGNFIKATSAEVAALNAKNSVIGADYNELTVEPSGEAVNQIYRGENNAGQTFFVEIDKNVHVEVM